MQAAQLLCRLVTKFTPIIARIYPENTTLQAALAAANAACAELHVQLEAVRDYGV
jgi:hypothetical protein